MQIDDPFELLYNKDINLLNRDYYFSTTTNKYDRVTCNNYLQYCEIANFQFDFLKKNTNLSGYFFVSWRINFSCLYDFIKLHYDKIGQNKIATTCIKNFEEFADILYERLEIE